MHQRTKGFTLLELLMGLLIASIGLLIAIPLYQDYRTKTKVTTGLQSAASLKSNVSQYFYINGEIPTSNQQAYSPDRTHFQNQWLEGIEISDTPVPGAIIITYNKNVLAALGDDNILLLQPSIVGGKIQWQCIGTRIPEDFRPRGCN